MFPRSLAPRSARAVMLLSGLVAVALVVVDVLIAARVRTGLSREGDRATVAAHSVGRMFTVVHAAEENAHADPGGGGPAAPVPAQYAVPARALADSIAADARTLGLGGPAEALDTALESWLAAPGGSLHPVLAAADTLVADLDRHRAVDRDRAVRAQETLFLLHCACVLSLLFVLGTVSYSLWRRIVRPLADLEGHLARAGAGAARAAGPAAPVGEPWLRGVWGEAERTLLLLQQSRHRAVKADEALRTDAATSYGLHRILAAQDRPGPGVTARGTVLAAEGVIAGDYVETLALPGGATALVQGDVSGHGVPAGLLAAQIKSAVVAALRLGRPPQVAAAAAWSVLAREDERFTTLVVALLDPAARRLTWLNAGHEIALLRRADGAVQALDTTGPVVGSFTLDPDGAWDVRETPFAPGDLLVLATDGLTEARDSTGAMLGRDAVTCLVARTGSDPGDTVQALYRAVSEHGADWERDDVTVLAAALAPDA